MSNIKRFKDFEAEAEKEELKKFKRGYTKNSVDTQQIIGNKKLKFNKVTRKMDDLSPDMIDDKIEGLKENLFRGKSKNK